MKLIALILSAVATISNYKQNLANATATIAAKDDAIKGQAEFIQKLSQQHATDVIDEAALKDAVDKAIADRDAAMAETATLKAEIAASDAAAAELAAALNAEPTAPNVTDGFGIPPVAGAPNPDPAPADPTPVV